MREPVCPEGWEPCLGPVRGVGLVTSAGSPDGKPRHVPGILSVGDRVMAFWQRFGYVLGNGTIVGFEQDEDGWVKVVIDYDYTDAYDVEHSHDGFIRWDADRTERVTGHWDGETIEQSVGRWRASLADRRVSGTTPDPIRDA